MANPTKRTLWIGVGLFALGALLLYRHYDLGRLLTLESLKSSRDALVGLYQQRPLATLLGYFALYVAMAALSIPGAAILTLSHTVAQLAPKESQVRSQGPYATAPPHHYRSTTSSMP